MINKRPHPFDYLIEPVCTFEVGKVDLQNTKVENLFEGWVRVTHGGKSEMQPITSFSPKLFKSLMKLHFCFTLSFNADLTVKPTIGTRIHKSENS